MFTQKNNLTVWVGKNVSNTAAATLVDNYSDLYNTEIAIIDITTNKVVQNAASLEYVRFVYRNGTQLLYSPILKGKNIIKTRTMSYSAPQEQISYLGHNGSSGSLETSNSKENILKIMFIDPFKELANKQFFKYGEYKTDASGSQAELCHGLYDSLLANFAKEPETRVRIERTVAGTSLAALTGSATIYKTTKGSTTVYTYTKAAAGDATLTASTASVTLNDVIQFPSSTSRTYSFTAPALGSSAGSIVVYLGETSYVVADAGTDAQNGAAVVTAINAGTQATASGTTTVTITMNPGVYAPCLVIKSDDDSTFTNVTVTHGDTVPVNYLAAATTSSAATFELDQPFQGESGYYYEGTTVGSCIGVLTATGNYGLKFTGMPRTNFIPGVFKYYKNRFKLAFTVDGAASTSTITYSQNAKEGQGTYEQIAELEWFAAGNHYNHGQRILQPGDLNYTTNTNSLKKYECLSFLIADDNDVVTLTGASPKSLTEYIWAFEKDSTQGDNLITYTNTIAGMTDFSAFA